MCAANAETRGASAHASDTAQAASDACLGCFGALIGGATP